MWQPGVVFMFLETPYRQLALKDIAFRALVINYPAGASVPGSAYCPFKSNRKGMFGLSTSCATD